jgi:hypothetical protein
MDLHLRSAISLLVIVTLINRTTLQAEEPTREVNHAERNLLHCIRRHLGDYQVEIVYAKGHPGRDLFLRILDEGKEIFIWKCHPETVFTRRGNVIYLADFRGTSTGCKLLAFDLKERKSLWNTNLKGLGPVAHFEYSNSVEIETDADYVVVRGFEDKGTYAEKVDPKTGKTVASKVTRKP